MPERRANPQKVHEYWVRQWEHRSDYYREWNDLYGRLMAFALDMEHYKSNRGFTANSLRIQPKGQQLYNLIRHKMSLLATTPISFDARPIQPIEDADAAMIARRVIEAKLENPVNRYKVNRARMILSALAGGRGCMAFEHDRAAGGTVLRLVDPRFLMHTPGYLDLHDPRTPDVVEVCRMRRSQVRRKKADGWDVPADLRADNWKPDHPNGVAQESHWVDLDDSSGAAMEASVGDGTEDDGIVTILKCYSRRDPFSQTRVAAVPRDLPQDEWYWTDGAQVRVPMMESPEPPFPGARLVTQDEDERELELYSGGYLCIVAPFYQGKKPLWEGTWLPGAVNTDVRLRSFPYMDMVGYLHPLRRAGKCDTELNHTLQVIDNVSLRAAWEQMRAAQLFITMLRGAWTNAQGQQFALSDEVIQMVYANDRVAMEGGIGFHQAPGMNAALPSFRQMLDRQWSFIGSGDISMPADRSRDVPVGTIQALQQQGDLPVQLHRMVLEAEESIGFGLVLDLERAYRSDAEIVQWVTDQGELASASVRGADLVDANVVITASPDWKSLDSDRMQAVAQFAGQMATIPDLMGELAPYAGFPPEGQRAIRRAAAKRDQMAQLQAENEQLKNALGMGDAGKGGGQPQMAGAA